MKKIVVLVLVFSIITTISYAFVINDFNEPSAFSRAIGGAIYSLYEGAQSVTYNPAGIANDESEVFFSHVEHFLGVIRNEFLSTSLQIGHTAFGGAIQYTYPTDELIYDQYKFTFCGAYKFEKNSVGISVNSWKGTDIKNSGFSMDIGGILNFSNVNLGIVAKNLFSSITWASTPSTIENYLPEFIVSTSYFSSYYILNGYVNVNSSEMGMGAIFPMTNIFDAMIGYKMIFGKNFSKELSMGMKVSYYNFVLNVSYVFKDPSQYGDAISPFYISLTYNFPKGM